MTTGSFHPNRTSLANGASTPANKDQNSLNNKGGDINTNRNGGLYDYGRLVYVQDKIDGFVLGKLVDIGAETLSVELLDSQKTVVKAAYHDVMSAEENYLKDVDDNCGLMYLNEATLLNNCKIRYAKKKIYTYVANILISINPYENVPELYSDKTIRCYEGKSLGTMPPHIFAIADKAYRDMKRLKQSQSIIVSGESGAGKTESQKCVLRYLCHCWGSSAGPIEQRILETNPILEAFGNAKTLRNNNSSRFGKFVEIHFNQKHQMAGGYVSHYLLEKTRVCFQQNGERNFHIFYQLFAGNGGDFTKKFHLSNPQNFNYLRNGCTQFFVHSSNSSKSDQRHLVDSMVDDFSDFDRIYRALLDIGFSSEERFDLLKMLAGILHLGNVEFDEKSDDTKGGTRILQSAEESLRNAAELFGLDPSQLRLGLTSRMMQPTKGGVKGTLIMVPLKCRECVAARDALAKALYSRLFDAIVARINKSIPFDSTVTSHFIGILDIAGFEFFEVNSFEQFCINYCNEKLQQFFNDRILRQEQDLYEKEGLNVPKIEFADNQDCIDLFEQKKSGILDLLDEESRLPKSSVQHFTLSAQQIHQKHPRIAPSRKSSQRRYREMREDEGFLVHHYAASVCYETSAFLEKNNDALHVSLEMLLEESANLMIKTLCAESAIEKSSQSNTKFATSKSASGKLNVASVGSKFRAQLLLLIEKLTNTSTHFVRCVKPNSEMAPGKFEGAQILNQLKCAGMTSVLKLMQKGFPSRTSFLELYKMYESALPPRLKRLDSRLFCKCLFYALGLNDKDYKFGMTKAFFRAGKFAEFDQLMRQDAESMRKLIEKVGSWIHRVRWRKLQYGAWSCIKLTNKIKYRAANLIILQTALRGALARRIHRPRILALQKLVKMRAASNQFEQIAGKNLTHESKAKWSQKIQEFVANVDRVIRRVKSDESMKTEEQNIISEECTGLQATFDTYLVQLKAQVENEERERIQRIQAEAKTQRMAEAAEKREREEQQKVLEERRQLEVQRQKALAFDAEREKWLHLEQKMTVKSANSNGQGHPVSMRDATTQGTQTEQAESMSSGKYDLLGWTYAKLRDAINTSTNIEFLEACREEFHRRLSAYQKWKVVNEKANVNDRGNDNYSNVSANIASSNSTGIVTSANSNATAQRIQRYFRVPFEKPIGTSDYSSYFSPHAAQLPSGVSSNCGFWYAHFDGQFIARQMELHPSKAPLLLVAGRNDDKMCELSLDETRLTHKKGAEILARDFEAVWQKYGGPPFFKPTRP